MHQMVSNRQRLKQIGPEKSACGRRFGCFIRITRYLEIFRIRVGNLRAGAGRILAGVCLRGLPRVGGMGGMLGGRNAGRRMAMS